MSKKMPKSNKVILSEEDIISRNAKESADFAEKVEAFINSDLPPNEVIRIGTLNCLQVLNSPNTPRVPLVIPQSVLANALGVKLSGQTKRQHTEPHNISVKAAKQMPDHLRSPICICKGNRPNTVVIVTDLIDGTGGNIIVPINTDAKTSGKSRVYKVASFYAKKNISSYIENAVINGTLLAVNIKKADMCSRNFSANIGRQLSKFGTLICFDDSIAYSLGNVKRFSEIYSKNFQISKDMEHLVENIPQTQDISHKTTNAALSAKRGESRGNIMEQNTDIVNEPREEIVDTDLAVGLAENGFHVYLNNTDRQLTFEKIYDYFDDYGRLKDGHTFTVPMMEVAQFGALETLCEKFESFNDEVRADGGLRGLSLEDYADELLDDEESHFEWRNGQSEWENVRRSILSGETKFLYNFLYDAAFDYPSRAAEIREDLNDYETTYFKEKQTDKTFAYEIGHSALFTVVNLDISTEKRKTAVSEALKNIIFNAFGERNDMSQPYKNLLEQIKPDTEFIHASEGHLSSLKYALRNAEANKELCLSLLDSIKNAESSPEKTIVIKGYDCLQKDAWEEHGVKFTIGQSVDDMSFYYARATDGKVTRDYEYDHKPDREKVMSDHADKLAEEDIDRGEAIYGADGYVAFPDPEMKHLVENIPQQRDISHKTTSAALSATRGESRGNIMEQNTKFEVSTMSKLEGDDHAKAIATLVVNGEFAVHGVRVVEGRNGLYAAMPSEKQSNGEYKDVVFPVTSEARAAIENAVLDTYGKLSASLEKSIKNDVAVPEKPVSKVYAQMHEVKSDSTQTKAAGQLTIDSCLVVTGVKLNEGTNAQGQTKNFVAMPARMNANGTYDDVAHPITADFHNKVDKAVIASANNIGRYEYKGVKYAELGENPVSSKPLHPKFADKLMNELDKAGIPYQAKCGERTTITVAAGDNQKFETVKKELTEKLNAKDKPKQTQEQKQTTGTRSTH